MALASFATARNKLEPPLKFVLKSKPDTKSAFDCGLANLTVMTRIDVEIVVVIGMVLGASALQAQIVERVNGPF